MCHGKFLLGSKLFFSFAILSVAILVLASETRADDSWLERTLVNWNKQAGRLAQPPQPSVAPRESANTNRCRQQVRQPASATERALVYDIPTLTPTNVAHRATCQTSEPAISGPDEGVPALFGKRWTLTEMDDRKFSADVPYIEFDRDQRRVSGSGGCNRFSGTFEIGGSMLKLSRILSTKRACLDAAVQRVETRFLQLLETTTRFEVQGNTLRLYANDRLALVFARK